MFVIVRYPTIASCGISELYGIAELWGKTNKERAKALIEIAHPKFREELDKAYFETIHKIV